MSANSASWGSGCRKRRSSSNRRLMTAPGAEKDRDKKRHDRAEENPPGKFHQRQPIGLRVKFGVKDVRDFVRQTAQNRDDDEAGDHGEHVAAIVPASAREHSRKEHPEQRSIGVPKNAEHDRD